MGSRPSRHVRRLTRYTLALIRRRYQPRGEYLLCEPMYPASPWPRETGQRPGWTRPSATPVTAVD